MSGVGIGFTVAGVAVGVHVFAGVLQHLFARRDRAGNQDKALVIFVESIRWLGVAWGKRTVAAGLRDAGFDGEFLYWPWHSTWRGWLVLPAIMDRRMLEKRSTELAEFIGACRRSKPDRPIYVIGYSCGAFVALRALELLKAGVTVEGAAFLAGAISPRHDLTAAAGAVRGPMVSSSSLADWLIAGVGTCIFGTADRKHAPAAGMVGLHGPGSEILTHVRWHPLYARFGHWGGHFAASGRGYVANIIAPALGIAQAR
ncbi:MAG: hypothetical protein LLG01_13610 [Planctomycetaceae bacterium]|nr:hypothetical protein [Planctomycetaceae bacterium]